MAHQPPTLAEVETVARELGLHFDAPDVEFFRRLLTPFGANASLLDALPDEFPPVRHPRTPGARPPADENPLGAWYVKTRIEGAAKGPLAGRTVALKDNVLVAGVPMMNGTSLLEGYVPPVDATVASIGGT